MRWHISELGKLTKIRTGKLDANANDPNGGYPFFTCAIKPLRIASYSYDCQCVLVAGNGDLNVKYYDGKFDAYQRTYIVESLDKQKLHTRYLYHFLDKYLVKLRQLSIGGVIKYIKLGNLTEAKIPLPPLPEQKRIASILDKADALRQKRKQAIAKLDKLLQSVFLQMFGDPVTNPKGWDVVAFTEAGSLDRGVSKHRPRNAPELLNGPYPLIQTGDVANSGGYIRNYSNTYSEIGLKQSKIWPKGTLCITIAANIANTGILMFDACFPDSVVGFVPNESSSIEYVQHLFGFLRKILEDKATQVAQKNINLSILRSLPIPLPEISQQKRFADFVNAVENEREQHRRHSTKMDNLFASLQQRAFKGEL